MFFSLRELAFWGQDAIKGSVIKKHCKDIEAKTSIDYDNSKELKSILEYAIKNVPYYNNISAPDLSLFPIMTKAIYKQNKELCLSKEYLNDTDNLYKAATSGSTGTPLIVYQESNKKNRVRADLISAHKKIGWKLGDHYVFIRNWVNNYKQSRLKNFAQNVLTVSISDFNEDKKSQLIKHLQKHKNSIIFGYSSAVCDFMRYVKTHNADTQKMKVKLIVCDSDELTTHNKRLLEKTFFCNVINRYDNEENGLIAISDIDTDTLRVNYQTLHVELLEIDSDKHVAPGEIGRVVITDLYNHAMPLIRYDTGDYAISDDESNGIRSIKELSGRKSDCLNSTKGVLVSSVAISGLTEIFESIVKYQLIQETADTFTFKYVGSLSQTDFNELSSRLYDCLGQAANIRYECVEDIAPGANGKYKTIINKLNLKGADTNIDEKKD